jgi:outer membrane receptor for ferrienterochelin and colicin
MTETVALSVSYFNTEVEDKIGLSDASTSAQELNYDYQWENLGNATSQGVEFESRFILLLVDDLQNFGFDASEKPDTQGRDHSLNDHHREMGHNGDLGDQKNSPFQRGEL